MAAGLEVVASAAAGLEVGARGAEVREAVVRAAAAKVVAGLELVARAGAVMEEVMASVVAMEVAAKVAPAAMAETEGLARVSTGGMVADCSHCIWRCTPWARSHDRARSPSANHTDRSRSRRT